MRSASRAARRVLAQTVAVPGITKGGTFDMQFRWWNSFNLLAVVLLAIGIGGAVSGGHMVFDPGRIPSGKEWILYLAAGGVMLVNGFLPPVHTPEKEAAPVAKSTSEKNAA